MDNNSDITEKMSEEKAHKKIDNLQKKIDTTKYNIEVSKEIIAETPYNAQQEQLTKKNIQRQHGIASIEKEIRDIEQTLEE